MKQVAWRVLLERKSTLNSNQAQRQKTDYAMAATAEEAMANVLTFQRNKAFIAINARRM